MSTKTANKDRGKKCRMCVTKAAQFYTFSDGKQVYFCSRKCHVKFNSRKAKSPNLLLVQLTDDDKQDEISKDEETDDLFESCQRGEENTNKLISFLESGAPPDQQNPQGQTLLTYSIARGDIRTVATLLGAGADINKADGKKKTPLMVAASIGADVKVALLLKSGANPLLQDDDGRTALHFTESNTTSDCAQLLLDHEPELLNVKNNFEQTPTHIMAGAGNETVLSVLLEHGASIDNLDNLRRAPLHWAVLEKAESCVPMLLRREDDSHVIDLIDRFGSSPIHYAVQLNNIDIVQRLIDKGCNLDSTDPMGRTPLLAAASGGNWDVCWKLLETGCDVNATDNQGCTCLHYAAAKGQLDFCKSLMDSGADVNIRNNKEQTAMFEAVSHNHIDIVHLLIEKGAKLDGITDANGRNPSHYAAEKGHKAMLRVILQYSEICSGNGCDLCDPSDNPIHSMDNDGHTTLYLAAANKHIACLKMLIKRGVFVDDESYDLLAKMGLIDIVDENKRLSDQSGKEDMPSDAPKEDVEEGFPSDENDYWELQEEENKSSDTESHVTEQERHEVKSDVDDVAEETVPWKETETESKKEVVDEEDYDAEDEETAASDEDDVTADEEGIMTGSSEESGEGEDTEDEGREGSAEDDITVVKESTEDKCAEESDGEDSIANNGHDEDTEDKTTRESGTYNGDENTTDKTDAEEEESDTGNEDVKDKAEPNKEEHDEVESDAVTEERENKEDIMETDEENSRYLQTTIDEAEEELHVEDVVVDSDKNIHIVTDTQSPSSENSNTDDNSGDIEDTLTSDIDKETDCEPEMHVEENYEIQMNIDSKKDNLENNAKEIENSAQADNGVLQAQNDNANVFENDSDNVLVLNQSEASKNDIEHLAETDNQSGLNRSKHVSELLIDKACKVEDLCTNDCQKEEPLHLAYRVVSTEAVEQFPKSKTDIPIIENKPNELNRQILHPASKIGLQRAVTLPRIRKNVNFVSTYSKNPLVWKRRYMEQRKQTLSLEEKLNRLKSQVEQYQRRLASHLEHKKEEDKSKERLRDPKVSMCQQTHENEMLRMQVAVHKSKASSETKLRNLQQKEMNGIRTLRDDYRNAIKKFTLTLDELRLLEAPAWFHPGKVTSTNPAQFKWMKSSRKVSYSQKFRVSKGENENKMALQTALVTFAQQKRKENSPELKS